MRVAIVGSRKFYDFYHVVKVLRDFRKEHDVEAIVSGKAVGADFFGEIYALSRGINFIGHPANWELHGRSAGIIRNLDIVEDSDEVIAFWDGKSPGTKNTISVAEDKGKKVHIHLFVQDMKYLLLSTGIWIRLAPYSFEFFEYTYNKKSEEAKPAFTYEVHDTVKNHGKETFGLYHEFHIVNILEVIYKEPAEVWFDLVLNNITPIKWVKDRRTFTTPYRDGR